LIGRADVVIEDLHFCYRQHDLFLIYPDLLPAMLYNLLREDVMKSHPYLRAYMAGVLLPRWVLLLALAAFLLTHFTEPGPAGLERAFVFPMAIVPNVWGLWNVLYTLPALRGRISIGVFGALLPLILVPAGVALASVLGLGFYTARQAALGLPLAMAVYYLAWQYAVGFFNRIVELH
jgi:hypothetical protein